MVLRLLAACAASAEIGADGEVNVYDGVTRRCRSDEPYRVTAFEGLHNIAPIVGSGIVRGKEAQLEKLAAEGARAVETWLRENSGWFTPEPGAGRVEIGRAALRRRSAEAAPDAAPGINSRLLSRPRVGREPALLIGPSSGMAPREMRRKPPWRRQNSNVTSRT